MVRKLSEDVRVRVLGAAEEVFARASYRGATMADIAARAEVSTGNIYRYFADKDALFYTVVPDELAGRFLRLLQRRVKSLVDGHALSDLDGEAQERAEELLHFWIEHRLAVIILLDRADGSRHEDFKDRFVDALMRATLAKLEGDLGAERVPKAARFILTQIFRNTVRTIVSILDEYEDEAQIRHAFQGFWSYQLAGLTGFRKWVQS